MDSLLLSKEFSIEIDDELLQDHEDDFIAPDSVQETLIARIDIDAHSSIRDFASNLAEEADMSW